MIRTLISLVLLALLALGPASVAADDSLDGDFDALDTLRGADRVMSLNLMDHKLSLVFATLAKSMQIKIRFRVAHDRPVSIQRSGTVKELLVFLAVENELEYEVRDPSSLVVTDQASVGPSN